MIALPLALAVSSWSLVAPTATLAGEAKDAIVIDGRVALVSHTTTGPTPRRLLTRVTAPPDPRAAPTLTPGPAVPDTAVSAGACGGAVHVVDARGLVHLGEGKGADVVIIAAAPLFPVADPTTLPLVDVCPGERERLLFVAGGVLAATVVGDAVTDVRLLRFAHRARAYAGAASRALRGERPYAGALSLYAPRAMALDADADGDTDLVLVHERRAVVFMRGADGALDPAPVERDLAAAAGAAAGADVDVRAAIAAAGLAVTVSQGAVPERTDLVVLAGADGAPLSRVVGRRAVNGLGLLMDGGVLARVDTSLVSLSSVVLSGRVPLELSPLLSDEAWGALPTLADVRQGKIDGALPVADVDLDGDGSRDVLDLGDPGRTVWRRVEQSSPAKPGRLVEVSTVAAPRAELARGLPQARAVVVIGRPWNGRTPLALVRAVAR